MLSTSSCLAHRPDGGTAATHGRRSRDARSVRRVTDPTGGPPADAEPWTAVGGPLSAGERLVDELLEAAHLLPPHEVPALLAEHATRLGVREALAYLADLQQEVLVPFVGAGGAGVDLTLGPLLVDATLAGRAYQQSQVLTQAADDGRVRVWLPLLDGSERLGVLTVLAPSEQALQADDAALLARLGRLGSMAAELIMTKTSYGDSIVCARRSAQMGLAAEMQWGLLPPLTFACPAVTVSGALEPAYEVAGDTIDYAVDAGCTRVALFDGMGHGLQSAQLASLAVAAYRNARRSGSGLAETVRCIDEALLAGFGGEAFTTAVLAELDTDTGRLDWVCSGHPEPLLLRGGRLIRALHVEPGPPLGLGHAADPTGPAQRVTVGSEQLEPGDRVLLYTDGVVEARSPEGDFFGVQRLVDLLTRNLAGGLPTPETMRRVVRALLAHQQGRLSDDASLLLVEWRTGNEQAVLPAPP